MGEEAKGKRNGEAETTGRALGIISSQAARETAEAAILQPQCVPLPATHAPTLLPTGAHPASRRIFELPLEREKSF
ncbi:hypothetical protein K0M31_002445 [Melipona bicolor]|uniref:Uncharacterized protein n=1 Tax=Melipona bicolor TaxID=60889 RepID=A0AA40GHJ0_9HYME|nr:hypothetical protein K0M31_002445 [Melipona bicolor]